MFYMPDMPQPHQPCRQHQLNYFEGFSRTVYTVDEEKQFPDGHLIVSCTDLKGVITHANEAFVIMSGWQRSELIGAHHSILRHPDMPKVAFKGLWDAMAERTKWHGYVKNLRKDGGFYWVYATVIPNVRHGEVVGYTSVWRKPSRSKIDALSAVYAQWLAEEQGGAA